MSRPKPDGESSLPPSAEVVLSYLRRFGWNTNSFLLTHAGYQWFESSDPPGLIAYFRRGRTFVVAGDPLSDKSDAAQVLQAFRRSIGPTCRIAFVLASAWFAEIVEPLGFGTLIIGEDPFFDLATWAPTGHRAKKVRNPVNRARRAGITVTAYEPAIERNAALEDAILDCATSWLGTRLAEPMGFLAELHPLTRVEERYFSLAWHDQRLVGFVASSPIYARRGWYLEDVIRRPDAPYGVSEILITTALAALREKGAALATLGIAPFTDAVRGDTAWRNLVLRALPVISRPFYNFVGIRNFKRKFAPTWWEPVYVAFLPNRVSPTLIFDTLNAFPPRGLGRLILDWLTPARCPATAQVAQ